MAKTLKELYDNNELPKGLYYIERKMENGSSTYIIGVYEQGSWTSDYNYPLCGVKSKDIIGCVPSYEEIAYLEKSHEALVKLYKKLNVVLTLNDKPIKIITFDDMVEGILNDDCRF